MTSFQSPNSETSPREKMYRITTMYPEDPRAPFYDPSRKEMAPMARLHLIREKVISRGCDEETLQALVVEDEDEVQETAKRELYYGNRLQYNAIMLSQAFACGYARLNFSATAEQA